MLKELFGSDTEGVASETSTVERLVSAIARSGQEVVTARADLVPDLAAADAAPAEDESRISTDFPDRTAEALPSHDDKIPAPIEVISDAVQIADGVERLRHAA